VSDPQPEPPAPPTSAAPAATRPDPESHDQAAVAASASGSTPAEGQTAAGAATTSGATLQGGSTAAGACFFCGKDLRSGSYFCTECKRYQPTTKSTTAFATRACTTCGEQILGGAYRCVYCESYQKGFRALLPASSATVALLSALLSTIALVGTGGMTLLNYFRARSETSVAYSQLSDDSTLKLRVTNLGTRPAHLTQAFLQIRKKCQLRDEKALCVEQPSDGPVLVLETDQGRINPGDTLASLPLLVQFPADDLPPVVKDCEPSTWDDTLKSLRVCVEIGLREHQQENPHCRSFEVPASSPRMKPIVEEVTRCPG
jgi:hypothetical protein